MSSLELLVCVLLLATSGFLSSSEIALFSLSRFQLRSLKERFRSKHRKIKRLLSDTAGLLVTILVMNEIVNISISTLFAGVISRNWETMDAGSPLGILRTLVSGTVPAWAVQTVIATLISTPLVLLFGEVTPKVIAARANQLIALMNVGLLSWIYTLLKPVRVIVTQSVGWISGENRQALSSAEDRPLLLEEEFLSMVEEGHKEGAVHESEMELIRNVFELDDTAVCDVCTPLPQVYSLSIDTPLKSAFSAMKTKKFSRVPITGKNRKNVVGILYTKDLLPARLDPAMNHETVEALMRKPLTVTPNTRLNALFRRLKQHRTHMAIVENAAGETTGVVTMGDVLNALFEDILPDTNEAEAGGGKR